MTDFVGAHLSKTLFWKTFDFFSLSRKNWILAGNRVKVHKFYVYNFNIGSSSGRHIVPLPEYGPVTTNFNKYMSVPKRKGAPVKQKRFRN